MSAAPEISVLFPVWNELANIELLYAEVVKAMEGFGRSFEMLAVDDGSSDGSFEALRLLREGDPRLRIIRLARNFGQNPALYAGFAHVRGRIVVTIDSDLQNPPADIPKLILELETGNYDIVQGWRQQRQDNPFRRIASRGVNRFMSRATGVQINDLGSGMKAYRREIITRLCMSTHHSRYIPAETAWLGVRVGEVQVGHRERYSGESKYSLMKLLRVNFDMITSISATPVQAIGGLGFIFSLVGFAMGLRLCYVRVFIGNLNDFELTAALMFFIAGVQMFCTSILCEYVSRIYVEVQNRPYYIIDEILE